MKLSEVQVKKITQAVISAEKLTSAEICPMVVKSSVPISYLRPILFLLFMCLELLAFSIFGLSIWGPLSLHAYGLDYLILIIIAIFFAVLFSKIEFVQRLFLFSNDIFECVERRAESEFYQHKIFMTKNRVGVLLFVSLLEHRVVVLADEAISKVLPQDTWLNVIKVVIDDIKSKNLTDALVTGVDHLAKILKDKFPAEINDIDELSNRVIIKD